MVALFFASTAAAATNFNWLIRSWQTDEGLPNNKVGHIAQSADGYLWLTLPHDLARFDGVRFTKFPLSDFFGGRGSTVTRLLPDRQGNLWMVPSHGQILGLSPFLSRIVLPRSDFPNRGLVAASDDSGALWLAFTNGIFRIVDGQVNEFGEKDGLPLGAVNDLVTDRENNVWLAKGRKICVFHNGHFQQVTNFTSETLHLTAAQTNGIWFTANAELFKCNARGELTDYGTIPLGLHFTPSAILEDDAGAVWIGTDGDGLFRRDESGFEKIDQVYPYVSSLLEDREQNIWAGTTGGGLERISRNGVRLEQFNHGSSPLQSICEDARGVIWGVTKSRVLVTRANNQWLPVLTNRAFAQNATCVAAGKNGELWVGTADGQIYCRNNDDFTNQNVGTRPDALFACANGDLLIAGQNRYVQRLHEGTLDRLKISRMQITALVEDARGTVWAGSSRGQLYRIEGGTAVNETTNLPAPGGNICCLYPTPDGSLWIGRGGGGLVRFKNGRFDQISTDDGLPDDYISQIVADDDGWMWFAADHGIFKIRSRELEDALDGRAEQVRAVVYGRNESLASLEAIFSTTAPFVSPYGLRSRDGRIWLLTGTGVLVADPKILHKRYKPPPVFITQVKLDNQIIASDDEIDSPANLQRLRAPLKFPPGRRKLDFEFTAPDFSAPENVRFAYRLDNLDDSWTEADSRSASYSGLPAGNYRFRIRASIDGGDWHEAPNAFAFTVAPFFWQTWWFRIGALLLFTAMVVGVVRYVSFQRLRKKLSAIEQQAAIERERGRIARDIHDDLGDRLTRIQLLTGLLQRGGETPEKSASHVLQISSTARQATDALDEIVWAINPRNDTLPHLINYLGQFAVEFLRTAGIRCRVDLPESPSRRPVSAEVRHNLFLVVKESLNNIVRHAGATEVFLMIVATDESLSFIIEDNGHGFNGDIKNGSDGLTNMRHRIDEIGGRFQVKSERGAGTCVSFSGPWLIKK